MSRRKQGSQKKRTARDDDDAEEGTPAPVAAPTKKPSHADERLSVLQMVTHDVTALAMATWAGDAPASFDLSVVEKVYADLLLPGDLSQLVMLETTKYLER